MRHQKLWSIAGWICLGGGIAFGLFSGLMLILGITRALSGRPLSVSGGDQLPGYLPVLYSDARILPSVYLVGSVVAALAGLGLIRRTRYGRNMALVFAVLSAGWILFGVSHSWLGLLDPKPDGRSPSFWLAPVVFTTLFALVYIVSALSLSRSLWKHPDAFS